MSISDEDVRNAYRFILGRQPESEELVRSHRDTHRSVAELRIALLKSEEFQNLRFRGPFLPYEPQPAGREHLLTREDVIQCYKTVLNRDPEAEDVVKQLLAETTSIWSLIERFLFSDEFKTALGYSRATRTDVMEGYTRILKRKPESELAVEHHLSGGTTHWDLVSRLVESEEHKNYVVNLSAMSLLKCIGRTYLANSFGDRDKYICFFHHYMFLAEAASPESFQNILLNDFCLFTFNRGPDVYAITLQSNRELDNEGEIILQFQSNGTTIYSLTFSIVPGDVLGGVTSGSVILISRLQGKVGKFEDMRLATKAMGEITPQISLIAALQGIAAAVGVRTVAGVAAANQLSYEVGEAELFDRAYDRFFRSIGAAGPLGGFYFFEAPLQEKPLTPGHRGRKQLKREFRKAIANAARVAWRDTIGLKRNGAVYDPIRVEAEKSSADEVAPQVFA